MADVVFSTVEDGVAVITINRPEARNAVNGAVAAASLAALADEFDARKDVSGHRADRRGRHVQRGHGPEGLPDRRLPNVPGRGFGGHGRAAAGQAGHRRGRGLRAGRRVRAGAVLRPGRGQRGGQVRAARGVRRGLVAGGRRAAPAAPADPLPPGHGDRADRRALLRAEAAGGGPDQLAGAGGRGARRRPRRWPGGWRKNAPLALAATKRVIVESADWPSDEAFAKQGAITAPVFTSADAREGALAFAERRAPQWKGE